MKTLISTLCPIGLMGVIMSIYSCSKDETITPLQQSVGIYDYYQGNLGGGSPDDNGNFKTGDGRIVIRNVSNNKISLTVYIKNSIDEKVWTISQCEIMALDTTGDFGAPFGRIIDIRDNSEVGTLNNFPYVYGNTLKSVRRITIKANSFIFGNQGILHLNGYAIKQKE
jgi:hypothetical protein